MDLRDKRLKVGDRRGATRPEFIGHDGGSSQRLVVRSDRRATQHAYFYYYYPTAKVGTGCTLTITGANPCFAAYNPASRPADADIANFTNDRGDTVKGLLRLEKGTINRSIYQVLSHFDPAKPWQPWAPQKGWNGKLMWKMGASTSANRFEEAPSAVLAVGGTIFDVNALAGGFMIANSSSTEYSQNNHELLSAETMMMVKEHIIEKYGEIRYTMSDGGSGGSMMRYCNRDAGSAGRHSAVGQLSGCRQHLDRDRSLIQ